MHKPDALRAALSAGPLGVTPLVGDLVIGAKNGAREELYLCQFTPKGVTVCLHRSDIERPHTGVQVVIPRAGWGRLATCEPEELPKTLKDAKPVFTGNLTFFIRHIPSVMGAIRAAAPVLSA